LVRLCTDAVAFFDYEPELPTLIIRRRRTDAPTKDLFVGVSPMTSIDINPKIEMEVSEVVLPYVTRASDGRTQFQAQTFGTSTAPHRKRQVITISGPELDTYLPNFKYDTADIGTSSIYSSAVKTLIAQQLGYNANAFSLSPGISATIVNARGCNWPVDYVSTNSFSIPGPNLTANRQSIINTHQILTSGTVPSWLTTQPITATLSGNIYTYHRYDTGCSETQTWPLPSNWNTIPWDNDKLGYTDKSFFGQKVRYAWKSFSITVTAIQGSGGTFYAPSDYTFVNPPAGLAQFLKECADFVPYEGTIVLQEQDIPQFGYRGGCINIKNSLSEYSNMKALVSSEQMIVESGQTTITLGTPARFDYSNLVDRIRRTSQDNIVYL
jgi:hypothetical protein